MYLGLDIGTTATKAVLVDEHHAIVATATARVQSVPAHPGNQLSPLFRWIFIGSGGLLS